MRAYRAFKAEYQEAIDKVHIERYVEDSTQEVWTGTEWLGAPDGTFHSAVIGHFESAFTFPTGEFLLSGNYGQSLRLTGKNFVLNIIEFPGDPGYASTTRSLEPGWYYTYKQDVAGQGVFPGGSWVLNQNEAQSLFLSKIVFDLTRFQVVVTRTPQDEFSIKVNGRVSCNSDARRVAQEFPDVASLLTLKAPPSVYTTPAEWISPGQ
jgi:hypothetical protein